MPCAYRVIVIILIGSFFILPTSSWVILPTSAKSTIPLIGSQPTLASRTCREYAHSHQTRTAHKLSDPSLDIFDIFDPSPFIVVAVAIGLGVAAQGFINQMLEGDQGLGAFLKDGSGYNKSGFRKAAGKSERGEDPLPWLKLPQLDFVEVAGQPNRQQDQALLEQLESLRGQMNEQLEQGKVLEATTLRNELEALMKDAGIEYNVDQL